MGPWTSVLIIKVSLLVRCPDFRGLNVCTLIQMGPWTSVLIIKVSLLVRCPTNKSPCTEFGYEQITLYRVQLDTSHPVQSSADFRGLNVCTLILHSHQLASSVLLGTVQFGPAKVSRVNTYQPSRTEPS